VVNQTFDLFDKLGASDEQLDFPVVYASALNGWATLDVKVAKSGVPAGEATMRPLFETIIGSVPVPVGDVDGPLQFQVSALDYSSYLGRLAIGRIRRGTMVPGQEVAVLSQNAAEGSTPKKAKIVQVLGFAGLERKAIDTASAGDIVMVTGIDELGIGNDPHGRRRARGAAADHGRRAYAVDVLPGEHVPPGRPRRQVRDVAQPARTAREGALGQHGAARRGDG
jgi:GTP-binding protein